MIKGKGNNMGKANMGVVGQGKEKTQRENPQITMQSMKVNKCKERLRKWVALAWAHKRKNDKQNPRGIMMIKKKRNLKAIKRTKKGKTWGN